MKKIWTCLLIAALSMSLLAGCKKQEPKEPTPQKPAAEKPVEKDPHAGEARSYLTGMWVDKELAKKRPVAVMLGNTPAALPQYGISEADVIIEAPVEGGLTRLMAIFQDYEALERVQSVRSCRHYYVDWMLEFDAIYAHYGQSKYAKAVLSQDHVDNLNGMEAKMSRDLYLRDSSRKAPHNSYTDGVHLRDAIAYKEYETEHSADYQGHYRFTEDDEKQIQLSEGQEAGVVRPGYRQSDPKFVYNEATGLYDRYEYGAKQVDAIDNSQLSCKNIILQICDWKVIDDQYGYLDVDTMDGQKGYYITNGKAMPITWSKESQTAPTRYFYEDGTEITLNQGKTWVSVIQDTYADRITIGNTEEE